MIKINLFLILKNFILVPGQVASSSPIIGQFCFILCLIGYNLVDFVASQVGI